MFFVCQQAWLFTAVNEFLGKEDPFQTLLFGTQLGIVDLIFNKIQIRDTISTENKYIYIYVYYIYASCALILICYILQVLSYIIYTSKAGNNCIR